MGEQKIWTKIMENLGNIITLLTLLGTIVLGISDIRRRRAEANLSNANADTQIMSQIKQASIDLVNEMQEDKHNLEMETQSLRAEIRYYKGLLRDHGISFRSYDSSQLPTVKKDTKQ
jgi:hypothetical protein